MSVYRTDESEGLPNQIDIYVGRRVRLRRTILGLSQADIGEKLNLTFQQVQKYEQGTHRIGSSRLYDLSAILDVSITYFFDGMLEDVATNALPYNSLDLRNDPAAKRETLELVRAFSKIGNQAVKDSILNIINELNTKD